MSTELGLLLPYVPPGGSGATFVLFAGTLAALLALAGILGVRRWLALVAGLGATALLVACGLWRAAAGHPGLGTIAPVDTGYSLDGHGTSTLRPGVLAAAMALGLALEAALFLLVLRPRWPPRAGRWTAREGVWVGVAATVLGAATWFLRFDDLTRLHAAAAAGRAATVARILARAPELADAPHFDRLALWRAARRGDPEVVRLLLEAGADPRLRRFVPTRDGPADPFLQAARGGHVEAARLLLHAGVEPEHGADTPGYLHVAAREGQLGIVRLLLDEGRPVDALAPNGAEPQTALYFAHDAAIMQELLLRGADPRLGTPLHGAVRRDVESVRLLLAAGADPDRVDAQGRTALGLADMEAARLLIDAGADLELAHPLHLAVRRHSTGTVKTLLEAGADPNALDADGKAPLAYADLRVIRELLEAHGAH